MNRVLSIATGLSWFVWLAPRLWLRADRLLVRRRLDGTTPVIHHRSPLERNNQPRQVSASLDELAAATRDAARDIRSGAVPGVALARSLTAHCRHSPDMQALSADLDSALPIGDAVARAVARDRGRSQVECADARFVSLLAAGTVESLLTPSTLDRVADVLDDLAARDADVRIAAAHAALTVRFLTLLPIGVAALAWLTSEELRAGWRHPAVAVPCAIGICLHVIGRLVVRRVVSSVRVAAREHEGSASRLADTVAAGLAAGLPVTAACARLDVDPACGDAARQVVRALRDGVPLSVALAPLAAAPETAAVAETILSVAHGGAGGTESAMRLADGSRRRRAEQTRAAVAALPGRLSVPVTLFVLPSFLVGVLVPVVATGARLA